MDRLLDRHIGLLVLLLGGGYLTLVLLLPSGVFWSPDEGSKYLQMLSYSWKGGPVVEVPYPGRPIDPSYDFYPHRLSPSDPSYGLSLTYPQPRSDGGAVFNWNPTFPVMAKPLYLVFGFRGLHAIPILGALAIAGLCVSISRAAGAKESGALLAATCASLASPIFFYALLFWEHTPAVALALGTLAILVSGTTLLRTIGALALGGAAVVLRHELVLFGAAVTLASFWVRHSTTTESLRESTSQSRRVPSRQSNSRNRMAVLVMAVVAVGIVSASWNKLSLWPPAAGSAEAMFADKIVELYGSHHFWSRVDERLLAVLMGAELPTNPSIPSLLRKSAAAGLLLAIASCWAGVRRRGWLLLLAIVPMLVATAWAVTAANRFREVHALLLPYPLAVLSIPFVLGSLRDPSPARRLLSATTLITFVLGIMATLPLLFGGLEWGNRYLLVLYPLSTVCAFLSIQDLAKSGLPAFRTTLVVVVAVAVGLGALFQLRGWREIRLAKDNLEIYSETLESLSGPVVTDLYWLPGSLALRFAHQPIFVVSDSRLLADWLRLRGGVADRFHVLTIAPGLERLEPWLNAARTRDLVPIEDRNVAGLRLVTFAQQSTAKALLNSAPQ